MTMLRAITALAGWLLAATAALAQPDCGAEDTPCTVAGAKYYVALPDEAHGAPVVLFLHGYAASGAAAIRDSNLARQFTGRGYALVAPDGQPDPLSPDLLDWGVADGFDQPRDDRAVLTAVRDDALRRFGLGPRLLLAGYSRGGSMVWDIACADPGFADAYASASGAFWEPMPESCAGGIHLHHSHGFTDSTVPLEGRRVAFHDMKFEQGNVFKALGIVLRADGCPDMATESVAVDGTWEKMWKGCAAGSVHLVLHPGGHGRVSGWPGKILDWFETPD